MQVVTLNPTFHRTPLVKGVEGSVVDAYNTTDKATQAEYGPGYLKVRRTTKECAGGSTLPA